jgi:uroporphyrinogen-III synthase
MADFIITIRPEPDASRDVGWLNRYQVPAIALPVMQAKKQPFNLPDAASFQAIIFTSRHAVAALADLSKHVSLRSLPVYAVGRSTALAARQAGFDQVTSGQGTGEELKTLITANLRQDAGKLLWPRATIISFDIASHLAEFGFSVQQIPVYAMTPTVGYATGLLAQLTACSSAAVVAMSARSMALFSQVLENPEFKDQRKIITVIAGSTPIAAAAGSGWANIIVAKAPRRSRILAIATFVHRRPGMLPLAL